MYTYKFRLYPTKAQETLLSKHFGCTRFIYNYFLNHRNEIYQQTKKGSTYIKDCLKLTQIKKDLPWLGEVNCQSLQAGLKNLDSAFKNFFARRSNFPKFKSRKSKQSYKIPQFIKIDKWYPSSKTCNNCGNINTELQLSQREWKCPSCKKILDRDLNAAQNILTVGLHGLVKS